MVVRASSLEKLSKISNSDRKKKCFGGYLFLCSRGCAPKSVGTRKSPTYLTRRLATAGLDLEAVMMPRARIIRRYRRAKFTLFCCASAGSFFSCCDRVAAPRQRHGHHDQVAAKIKERRRGYRPRRTRIIQRYKRVNLALSHQHQQSCSSPAATTPRPRQRPGHHD